MEGTCTDSCTSKWDTFQILLLGKYRSDNYSRKTWCTFETTVACLTHPKRSQVQKCCRLFQRNFLLCPKKNFGHAKGKRKYPSYHPCAKMLAQTQNLYQEQMRRIISRKINFFTNLLSKKRKFQLQNSNKEIKEETKIDSPLSGVL